MNVAWIGLGNMGLPTAQTVAAAGHRVKAFDIKRPDEAQGLILTGSAREAAEEADLVCIAVFSDEQTEQLLMGPEGLFPMLRSGTVVAVFTTGTIESARRLAAAAPPGVAVLDSCFSRHSSLMDSGRLNLLIGGDAQAIERCRPAFESFAAEIFHMGPTGSGRAMKLLNNLLWVAHNRLTMDGLAFAEKLGLDPAEAISIVRKCSGASDVMGVYVQDQWREVAEFMEPYFVKDASAAVEAAREVGADLGGLGDAVKRYTGG